MDATAILGLYDQQMLANDHAVGVETVRLPGLRYSTMTTSAGRATWVTYTRLAAAEVDAAIDAVLAAHGPGGELEWKTFDLDTPADLRDRLRRRGFEPEEMEALLALDLAAVDVTHWQAAACEVRQLTTVDDFVQLAAVHSAVDGEDWSNFGAMLAEEYLAAPERMSVYVAVVDGQPVSTGWIRFHPGCAFADLWGGATLPAYRGRGIYRALVAARARDALAHGARFLTVDAGPMSRPILARLGFQFLMHTQPYIYRAEAVAHFE
jgi:GNAT superfamily N-acetyltransferase